MYSAALSICFWRLSWLRLWRELPALWIFTAASFVMSLLPWHPKDFGWVSTWGLWSVDVPTFALLVPVVLELLHSIRPKTSVVEFRLLQWSLVLAVMNCSFVFWNFVPVAAGGWYFRLVADRQFAMIELLAVVSVLALYVWARDVDVPGFLRAHSALLCALLVGRNVTNVCDPTTGLSKAFSWNALDSLWYLWSAVCFMAWALLLPWLVSRERSEEL